LWLFVTKESPGVYAVETMSGAHKKVVVRQFSGELMWGYLSSGGFVKSGQVELMGVDGRAKSFALNEIKWIAYLRDFTLEDRIEPERLGRKTFAGRPRGDGLWLRLNFTDGETIEGLAAVEMEFIDGLVEDGGLFLTPPDPRSNAHRMFVPRSALRRLEVLGYVTAPSKRSSRKPVSEAQGGLFEE
jgi:hypothetical protein